MSTNIDAVVFKMMAFNSEGWGKTEGTEKGLLKTRSCRCCPGMRYIVCKSRKIQVSVSIGNDRQNEFSTK